MNKQLVREATERCCDLLGTHAATMSECETAAGPFIRNGYQKIFKILPHLSVAQVWATGLNFIALQLF